jgi:hypothetical protein
MRINLVWVLAGALLMTVPIAAQSGGGDTLAALLVEVRQLRMAMERAATAAPRIQLLGARLSVQSERLARAAQDHNAVVQELDGVASAAADMNMRLQSLEGQAVVEINQQRQRASVQEQAALKEQLTQLSGREQRLRARESQLAAALGAEQAQWAEINNRVDEVERSLGMRQP